MCVFWDAFPLQVFQDPRRHRGSEIRPEPLASLIVLAGLQHVVAQSRLQLEPKAAACNGQATRHATASAFAMASTSSGACALRKQLVKMHADVFHVTRKQASAAVHSSHNYI